MSWDCQLDHQGGAGTRGWRCGHMGSTMEECCDDQEQYFVQLERVTGVETEGSQAI